MAGPNDLCETRGVERTVTEISANTASVIGHPIARPYPSPSWAPRRVRRRLPGGARILAFCEGDVVVLRSSVLSPTLPGDRGPPPCLARTCRDPAGLRRRAVVSRVDRRNGTVVDRQRARREPDAAGWISGDARRLAA